MCDVAAALYPWLPVRWVMDNRYDSLSRIKRFAGPYIQSHGTGDTLVPIAMARRLFEGAPSTNKKWLEFADLGHNDVWPDHYYIELATFLDRLVSPTGGSDPQ
jgi:fermentation-respiration switch protein FrsA (DUF1100 family)